MPGAHHDHAPAHADFTSGTNKKLPGLFSEDMSKGLVRNYRSGSRIFFMRGCTRLLLYFNTNSLRKQPFLLSLRRCPPAAKSEEKRMFSQASGVEVEQETSGLPPKKNPGSAPVISD